MGMDFDMNAAVALIGRQQIEITVLRERVALIQTHRCEPCSAECCASKAPEPSE